MDVTASSAALSLQSSDTESAKKNSKLHDAAQQFEALMLGEMLKSVREGDEDGWLGSGDGTGNDSAMDMAQNQLANVLATSGGFGLSHIIEQKMSSHSHDDDQNVAAVRTKLSTGS